jgi:hypothetical protein
MGQALSALRPSDIILASLLTRVIYGYLSYRIGIGSLSRLPSRRVALRVCACFSVISSKVATVPGR